MSVRNPLAVGLVFLTLSFLRHSGAAEVVQEKQRDQKNSAQWSVEEVIRELPVVDVNSALPMDSKERTRRELRGKKYNQGSPRIAPGVESTEIYHWPRGFPALPVVESDAVIVGQVFDAKAYLSADRTSAYSEFGVTIQSVIKTPSTNAIQAGSQLFVERAGARVRYPSSQMSSVLVDGFGVPRIGSRYVLFLKRNVQDKSYSILTGYELRDGRVKALDQSTSSETDFSVYNNFDETQFLKNLTSISQTVNLKR